MRVGDCVLADEFEFDKILNFIQIPQQEHKHNERTESVRIRIKYSYC